MGSFVYDKSRGDLAEKVVLQILKEAYPNKAFKKIDGKNSDYDIVEDSRSKNPLTIEVKFDIKAKETGNLCFEFTNGKRPTGVCVSKASEIWYVLESKEANHYIVFKFNRAKLLQHLLYHAITKQSKDIRIVYGGDFNKFGLIIIPLKTVVEENFGEIVKWEYTTDEQRPSKESAKSGV